MATSNPPKTTSESLFSPTPPAPSPTFETGEDCGIRTTSVRMIHDHIDMRFLPGGYPCAVDSLWYLQSPTIRNAPLPADGPGNDSFPNTLLISLLLGIPWCLSWRLGGGLKTTVFLFLLTAVPLLFGFWAIISRISPRRNDKVQFPRRPIEYYLTFKKPEDQAKYRGTHIKIPIETFQCMFFEGEVAFNGDALDILEYRHDWASWGFTLNLFKYILFNFAPEVIIHSRSQDEEQVRGHYE